MKWLKYFPALLKLRDAVTLYQQEQQTDKVPKILHRRVFGAFIIAVGTAIAVYTGVDFNADFWNGITDNVEALVGAGLALYGAVMHIVGWFKKDRS